MIRQSVDISADRPGLGLEALAELVTHVRVHDSCRAHAVSPTQAGAAVICVAEAGSMIGELIFDPDPRAGRARSDAGALAVHLELVPEASRRCRLAFHDPLRVSAAVHRAWSTPLVALMRHELATTARPEILHGAARLLILKAVSCASPGVDGQLSRDVEIEIVRRRLQNALEYPWTLSELAALAMMSRTTFCVRFHHTLGRPPMQYLNDLRMRHARHLLAHSNLPVKEIARRVGYRAVSAFGHAYKRHSGQSPAAFRNANAKRRGGDR